MAILFLAVIVVVLTLAGCARRPATVGVPAAAPIPGASGPGASAPAPGGVAPGGVQPGGIYTEQGVASWYGLPFHGRRASDGEIFDMNQLVAAHRTLPFGSMVRVTNLNNGLHIDVRIIDRGPFVSGRIIDLSLAAAKAINMVGSGIAPVRIEVLTAGSTVSNIFSVQVGAFQQRENAERLQAQFMARYPVYLQEYDAPAGHFYRVRVGRTTTQQEAEQLASQLASENGFQTFVVRLDGIQ